MFLFAYKELFNSLSLTESLKNENLLNYIWFKMSLYQIRKLTPDDIDTVHQLEQKFFKDEAYSRKYLRYLLSDKDFHYVIINERQEIVGYLVSVQDDEEFEEMLCPKHFNECRVLSIASIGIRETDRNRGLATQLIETLLTDVYDITYVALQVRVSNLAAIRLYQKLGFVTFPTLLAEYYSYPIEDGYLMYKTV